MEVFIKVNASNRGAWADVENIRISVANCLIADLGADVYTAVEAEEGLGRDNFAIAIF